MFGGVSDAQHEALRKIVDAQAKELEALRGLVMAISPLVRKLHQEKHVLVGLLGALVAELAGRSQHSAENLNTTLDRLERCGREHIFEDRPIEAEAAEELISYIKNYSAVYLRQETQKIQNAAG